MLSAFALITSVLTLLAVIYQIRILKRVNQKLLKLISPERDVRKSMRELEKSSRENYKQSEFYSQLLQLLTFTAPIPSTRSWAASPDLLLTLFHYGRTTQPKRIVDLGSGMSTLVLAKSAPQATIFSIDNSEEYAGKTRQLLADHGLTNVDLRVAPLAPHPSGIEWYERSKLSDISAIDLLFIDGPPGSKNLKARRPAIEEFIARLSPHAIIVIDDVAREGENLMAVEFAKQLPTHTLEFLPHEKGTAVIRPR